MGELTKAARTTLWSRGDSLFSNRQAFLSLWQDLAENFYPERADFTVSRTVGEELAAGLMTSRPVMLRRDLGNIFGTMLRPTAKPWFSLRAANQDEPDLPAKHWLERVAAIQRAAMYDPRAAFTRATAEGDQDFATFGQAVLSVELNHAANALLYRCWHLRDVVWTEDSAGAVGEVHRRWKPTLSVLKEVFPSTFPASLSQELAKEPTKEIEVRHIMIRAEAFKLVGGEAYIQPWVSVYLLHGVHGLEVLECVGSWSRHYVIPRWETVSGSQYAYSPATVAALPDARTLQQVALTLLESGEKAVNPPMLAVREALRSDVALYAGGITTVDAAYDERLGSVLRPLEMDKSGLAFGEAMVQDLREQLSDAFFLSKLSLPPQGGGDMTAYEVGQRVQEFIRNALPLLEPVENEYNAALCEATLDILLRNTPELRDSMPASLANASVRFVFESPLHEAAERAKAGMLQEAAMALSVAAQLDPSAGMLLDAQAAARDILESTVPAAWVRDKQAVSKLQRDQQAAQAAMMQLQAVQQGASAAKDLNAAGLPVADLVRGVQ